MSLKKQIFKLNALRKLLTEENSCVTLVPSTRLLALPPFFLNDMKSGILYFLNSILKKYDRTLDGIVIGYQNIKVLMDDNTGIIPMGAAETEVNVSVEFYIFQPKIGNYLEGVINKKSSNHIGCLVHRYFNATILKPEDVEYEDWLCRDFNVDDKIIFKVKDLDFTGLLPYIEGTFSEETLRDVKLGKCRHSDNNVVLGSIKKDGAKALTGQDKEGESGTGKITFDNNVNILCENELDGRKKKKKKKEKEKKAQKRREKGGETEKGSSKKEVMSCKNEEDHREVSHSEKKKKKKKEKEKEERKEKAQLKRSEVPFMDSSARPLEKLGIWDDGNDSQDFVKPKKRKKRKKDEEDSVINSKETERLPLREEDNVLFSTQLEPSLDSKKMRMSLSPIPAEESRLDEDTQRLLDSLMNSVHDEINGKKKKKQHKKPDRKRKRDQGEEEDGPAPPKKPKVTPSDVRMNGGSRSGHRSKGEAKSREVERERVNRVTVEAKEEGEESIYDKLMKDAMSAISGSEGKKKRGKKDKSVGEAKKRRSKGSEREGGPPAEKLRNGSMYDLDFTPEKRNPDKSLFTDSERSASPGKRKKAVNGVSSESKDPVEGRKPPTSSVQNMLDEFLRTEGQRLKSESDKDSGKETARKLKKEERGAKRSPLDSLYEKLLKEAKVKINFGSPQAKKAVGDLGGERGGHVKALF